MSLPLWNVKVIEAEDESDDIVAEFQDVPDSDLMPLLETLRTRMLTLFSDDAVMEHYRPDQRIVLTFAED